MFEMTIWLSLGWAPGDSGAGIPVIEDCPFGVLRAGSGGESLVPPQAVSTATQKRNGESSVVMRVM
ncbi:hypothetical protein MMON_15210 [Mycolicibacterium monacense]|uniref:Uncharacterized protein n=1 Tax=Mycolicibacterium monacense TaxID=85693 RepID=A0AAD1MZ54_MYCMB|nr:hypothetical protein MMON_15210 [Mycolicibacterium monacense]